jgi:uncharacterized protein YaeQ
MAQASTLYRFKIELSDVDRSIYESLDVRLAMHPSETSEFLLTRVLAYTLNFAEGLSFSDGLSTPDSPSIQTLGPNGEILKWIDIGNPSARRLHKASKASRSVRVYTYKNPENLKKELASESIHRAEEIEIFSFEPFFLAELGNTLKRDNVWSFIHTDGEIVITAGEQTFIGAVSAHRLAAAR